MVAQSLARRVSALEHGGNGFQAFQVVHQYEGQTEDEAIAAHESTHGPVIREGNVLYVVICKPYPPGARFGI